MKTGRSINELALEIHRQKEVKRDFLAPTSHLSMHPNGVLAISQGEDRFEGFPLTPHAHQQLGSWAGIPRSYYDLMKEEAPNLLASNVNHWFHVKQEDPEVRMVRVLDGKARAFLSQRYRPLDHYDLIDAALPELQKRSDLEIVSCEVTDARLYLKAMFTNAKMEVRKGDEVIAGIAISNSEVGAGSLRVEPLIYRLVCKNGMIGLAALRKYHIGRKGIFDTDDGAFELMSDRTKELTDAALWNTVKDAVKAMLNPEIFKANVDRLALAASVGIKAPVEITMERARKSFMWSKEEGSSIMDHLIRGGDLTQYGLANAVTRTAQDIESYDRATEFERLGGSIIELESKDWERIAA